MDRSTDLKLKVQQISGLHTFNFQPDYGANWTSCKTQLSASKTVPVVNCSLLLEVCLAEPKHSQNIDLHVCLANQHVQSYGSSDRRIFRVTSAVAK